MNTYYGMWRKLSETCFRQVTNTEDEFTNKGHCLKVQFVGFLGRQVGFHLEGRKVGDHVRDLHLKLRLRCAKIKLRISEHV